MIISGKEIERMKVVNGTKWDEQIQPAGIDLSVESIYSFETQGIIDGDNSKRKLPQYKKIDWKGSQIVLERGAYKIIFNETVEIAKNLVAIARSRSSLLRMGAFVATAVWDPGYKGRSEALLVVENLHGIVIRKDAKLAQLVFMQMQNEVETGYSGKYQSENL